MLFESFDVAARLLHLNFIAMKKIQISPRWLLLVILLAVLIAVALAPALNAAVGDDDQGSTAHLPEAPHVLQDRLASDSFSILSWKKAGGGIMGAKKLTLGYHRDGALIDVKWKRAPRGGDGWNNSPRREIGAWAVQQLFLESGDYVVPPTAAMCIPLEAYRRFDDDADPNLPRAECVFGVLSAWLQDVRPPRRLWDRQRFQRHPEYARQVANLNVLAYLINHQDGRKSNFLVSTRVGDERVFSVDNGLAFSWSFHNFFIRHWNRLRVPALPAATVERLRAISREDLEELAVLAQWERGSDGIYRPVPAGPNLDPEKGHRLHGNTLQIGLTRDEIDGLANRLAKLLKKLEEGKLGLLDS